ncbi:MAG: ribonuclease III [Ruminococcaceae bacterium]|nr:ribonuclease III [Oscillospiraceae bacterium]
MNALPKALSGLEAAIDYKFKNIGLLRTAMTHSSYKNEHRIKEPDCRCNERLEFLGDSVLSIITSEYLFAKFRDRDEGDLTKMRAEVVCERALAGFANQIRLNDYLLLGVGEEKNGGRNNKSMLSDAFEALLAAMYIDSGNQETVKKFLLPFISEELERLLARGQSKDYKTFLQQFLQQDGAANLSYVLISEEGPDHAKTFTVEARMGSNIIGKGSGKTKKDAEQNAAREALKLFGELEN